ncbi:MAG: hypothetical protein RBT60_14845 [Candidatus Krumholzibacteria bacterium]|jgi:hypothetical protein|nr:hypothetical protein [Candidatus Krumholzibacteria bacterium]
MNTRIIRPWSLIILTLLAIAGCGDDGTPGPTGPAGRDGQDATVYYSEWFSPTEWSGASGDWYFAASAPDLTADIVEEGVVLAYAWLEGDLYGGSSVRPLPAYAVGANWSFLIHEYGAIEFTCDMTTEPATTENYFRFIAIPGTIPALKSDSASRHSEQELRNMTYEEIVRLFGISECHQPPRGGHRGTVESDRVPARKPSATYRSAGRTPA